MGTDEQYDGVLDKYYGQVSAFLREKYGLGDGYRVVMQGTELEEIEGAGTDLYDAMHELVQQGYFPEDALDKAVTDRICLSRAPAGYMFVRLQCEGKPTVLVMTLVSELPALEMPGGAD